MSSKMSSFFLTQLRKNNYITIISNGWRLFESSFSEACWNCPSVQECYCRSCSKGGSATVESSNAACARTPLPPASASASDRSSTDSLRWVCSCTVASRATAPWTDAVDPLLLQKMSKYVCIFLCTCFDHNIVSFLLCL